MRITGINDGVQAEGADGLAITALAKSTKSSILTEQRGTTAETDTVDISDQGRALAALAAAEGDGTQAADTAGQADSSGATGAEDQSADSGGSASGDASDETGVFSLTASARDAKAAVSAYDGNKTANSTYEKILKEIQKLQEQIKEVQNDSSLTEEQKRVKVQDLQQQLLSLQSQLVKAKAMSAGDPLTYMGGTRAEGANFQMTSHMLPTDTGGSEA